MVSMYSGIWVLCILVYRVLCILVYGVLCILVHGFYAFWYIGFYAFWYMGFDVFWSMGSMHSGTWFFLYSRYIGLLVHDIGFYIF